MPTQVEVVQGTLDMLILKTLSRGEALHGFGVLAWLREATQGALILEEGSLYPALHRLEQKELIEGEWAISEKGRRARYYRITSSGKAQLRQDERKWSRYMVAWQQIVEASASA